MTHEELQEYCALYVLGALEASEAAEIEARLQAGDVAVQREVEAFRNAMHTLPLSLPSTAPDARIRERLLQHIRQERPQERPAPAPALRRRWWRPVLAIAATLLLAVLGTQVVTLQQQVETLRADVQRLESVAAERQRLLTMLASPQVTIVALPGSAQAPQAWARILRDGQRSEWVVVTHELPPLPPGKAYQLWFLVGGKPQPSGTFRPENGYGVLRTAVPALPGGVHGAAVSIEPEAGVTQPTGAIVLAGTF